MVLLQWGWNTTRVYHLSLLFLPLLHNWIFGREHLVYLRQNKRRQQELTRMWCFRGKKGKLGKERREVEPYQHLFSNYRDVGQSFSILFLGFSTYNMGVVFLFPARSGVTGQGDALDRTKTQRGSTSATKHISQRRNSVLLWEYNSRQVLILSNTIKYKL